MVTGVSGIRDAESPSLDEVLVIPFVLPMVTIAAAIRDFETMKAPHRAGSVRSEFPVLTGLDSMLSTEMLRSQFSTCTPFPELPDDIPTGYLLYSSSARVFALPYLPQQR